MEIASHHAESERVAAGINMEVRLLLDGIALKSGDVSEWNLQFTGIVEAHFANPAPAFRNEAAMAAGNAAYPPRFALPQCAADREAIQRVGESLVGDR